MFHCEDSKQIKRCLQILELYNIESRRKQSEFGTVSIYGGILALWRSRHIKRVSPPPAVGFWKCTTKIVLYLIEFLSSCFCRLLTMPPVCMMLLVAEDDCGAIDADRNNEIHSKGKL